MHVDARSVAKYTARRHVPCMGVYTAHRRVLRAAVAVCVLERLCQITQYHCNTFFRPQEQHETHEAVLADGNVCMGCWKGAHGLFWEGTRWDGLLCGEGGSSQWDSLLWEASQEDASQGEGSRWNAFQGEVRRRLLMGVISVGRLPMGSHSMGWLPMGRLLLGRHPVERHLSGKANNHARRSNASMAWGLRRPRRPGLGL